MEKATGQIILDTAEKHFVEKGFAAARMQEIADDAGINKALLHYYFRSKDKLYQVILQNILELIIPRIAHALGNEGSFLERTDRLIETHLTSLMENPAIPIFIMTGLSQKKDLFIEELQKHVMHFPAILSYLEQMKKDMENQVIRTIEPLHLFLNIMGLSVFPFMVKPIFKTVLSKSDEDFQSMMNQRKEILMDFIYHAVKIN